MHITKVTSLQLKNNSDLNNIESKRKLSKPSQLQLVHLINLINYLFTNKLNFVKKDFANLFNQVYCEVVVNQHIKSIHYQINFEVQQGSIEHSGIRCIRYPSRCIPLTKRSLAIVVYKSLNEFALKADIK